jgi:hypothetical protein
MEASAAAKLREIAACLQVLRPSPGAVLSYELLSDALVWSDEIPELEGARADRPFWPLRYVLRYRTSLILGAPEEQFREYWDAAQRLFPDWPGFDPRRQAPAFKAEYERFKAQAAADIRELFEEAP